MLDSVAHTTGNLYFVQLYIFFSFLACLYLRSCASFVCCFVFFVHHFCRLVRLLQRCTIVARSPCFPSSAGGISARTGSSPWPRQSSVRSVRHRSRFLLGFLMHLGLLYGRLVAICAPPPSILTSLTSIWLPKSPKAAWLARSPPLLFPASIAARSEWSPRKVNPENGDLSWIYLPPLSTVSTTGFLKIHFRF